MNHYIRRRRHTKRKDNRRAGLIALAAGCVVAGTVTAAGFYGYLQSGQGAGAPSVSGASVSQGDAVLGTVANLAETHPRPTEPESMETDGTKATEASGEETSPTFTARWADLPGFNEDMVRQITRAIGGISAGRKAGAEGTSEPASGTDGSQADRTTIAAADSGKGKAGAEASTEPSTSAASTESDTKAASAGKTVTGTDAQDAPAGQVPSTKAPAGASSTAAAPAKDGSSGASSTAAAPTKKDTAGTSPTTAAPAGNGSSGASPTAAAPAGNGSSGASSTTQAPTAAEPTTQAPTAPSTEAPPQTPPAGQPDAQQGGQVMTVSAKLQSMTLEQKVAQMFLVTPEELTGRGRVTSADDQTLAALRSYPVGGLVFFSNNMVSQGQVAQMSSQIQQYARQVEGLDLFLAADEEGGARSTIAGKGGMGIAPTTGIPAIGATLDSAQAYGIGSYIGKYMSGMGFNLDLAPVADVLTNPSNDVIQGRSFGNDASNVSDMTVQMMRGLKDQRVYGVLKHFPGHGSTDGRRMNGFPYTEKTLDELMQAEMVPFKQAIDQGADFIMAGHIVAPAVTGDQIPCSLSRVLITDVLRGRLGFQGIVVTDALNTPAVQRNYGSAQACVMAVQAGADILLMPKDFHGAYAAVLQAVRDGSISEARINESVERILMIKMGAKG